MVENDIGWNTPVNGAGEHTGLNDGGIEHFQHDPLGALAKEGSQNAQDAAKGGKPVHIRVRRISVPAGQIPGIEELRSIVAKCATGLDSADKKVAAFFATAQQKLVADTIDVLAFTDSNTTGLVGPCEPGKAFYALMKARGSNLKADDLALGSFGIGKMAPYANSDIRTIFASTAYHDEAGNVRRLVQGKSILTSHRDGDDIRDANSYWGVRKGFLPADPDLHRESIPSWMTEPHAEGEIGTTIFIPVFNGGDNWAPAFAAHYITTYFLGIHEGKATADIEGIRIDAQTLGQVISDPSLTAALEGNDEALLKFREAQAFYLALTSPDAYRVQRTFGRLGHGTLDILAADKFPSKVSVMRGGMQITVEMEGLVRFTALPPFAAVFRFEERATNELLRSMEPPRHDCFKIGRLPESLRQTARLGLKEAAREIREELENLLRGEVKEEVNLTELSDRLGDSDDASSRRNTSEVNPLGRISIREKARRLSMQGKRQASVTGVAPGTDSEGISPAPGHATSRKVSSKNDSPSGDDAGQTSAPEPTSAEAGTAATAPGGDGRPATTNFKIETPRGFRDGGGNWRITFHTEPDTECLMGFRPLGFTEAPESLEIQGVEGGTVVGRNGVRARSSVSGKVSLLVNFKNASIGGVKVVPHAL